MSVPKSKRKQSEMEFYDHAKRLRITVTEWLLNDFGIRPRALAIPRLAKGLSMSDEDRDAILNVLDKYGLTKDVVELFERLVRSYRVDISALSESERIWLETHPINLLTHKPSTEGRFFLNRSVGIGSPLSQIIGTAIPTPMDNQALQHPGVFSYNRYMDDSIALSDSKDALEDLLGKDRELAKKLGLFISEKKTEIFPIKKGFTFLQIKYSFPKEDKILQRLSPAAITRERRRLKKFSHIVGGSMSYREVANAYQSWRGNAVRFDSHRSVREMDRLYNHLFIDNFA